MELHTAYCYYYYQFILSRCSATLANVNVTNTSQLRFPTLISFHYSYPFARVAEHRDKTEANIFKDSLWGMHFDCKKKPKTETLWR